MHKNLNTAAKLESKDIDQLPVPFIACTIHRNDPFMVVNKYDDNEVSIFSGNYNKTRTLTRKEFLNNWDGVFLLAEPTEDSGDQAAVAKQWCLICLIVQTLLLSGGINIVTNGLWRSSSYFNIQTIATALALYAFPVLLWYSIKSLVLRLQSAKQTRREYLRLKFSDEIFTAHLQKQKTISQSSMEGLGIDIGNPQAAYTIIKVCNPYCGPCAKAHPEIEKIIEQNPNIKVKIIFTVSPDEKDLRNKPAKHLLAIADRSNEQLTRRALDDWYLAKQKDYDVFAAKYPVNGEIAQQHTRKDAMYKWCKETNIEFTPTIFISHPFFTEAGQQERLYQLPDAYDVDDINYFFLA